VVLDACGVGALPDAAQYGDAGANTLAHVAQAVGGLRLPVLEHLGLGSILPLQGVAPAAAPVLHGRLHALGPGKDSATGHWELMGVVPPGPLPVYPDGFPPAVMERLRAATGRRFCCNRPSDGVGALVAFGAHHLATGELILYTSQDSVLQIAAHVDRLSEAELHGVCAAARRVMTGRDAVGRVIARPFTGPVGAFERTEARKDLTIDPPGPSRLQELEAAGVPVHAVGKVSDLFAGVGVSDAHPGPTNATAIQRTTELLDSADRGLIFTNLIETDQRFGHRKDVAGFAAALEAIDVAVGGWLRVLRPRDLLVITADHGCDPASAHSDHTREHAPLLAAFAGHGSRRHDGPLADVGASVAQWLVGRHDPALPGVPFLA